MSEPMDRRRIPTLRTPMAAVLVVIGLLAACGTSTPRSAVSGNPASPTGAGAGLAMRGVDDVRTVVLPDLAGLTLDQAAQRVEDAGLTQGLIYVLPSASPKWTVLSQQPLPDAVVAHEANVNLFVSGGTSVSTASGTGVLTCRYEVDDHEAYCQGDKLIQYETRFGYTDTSGDSSEGS
jgi:hypothetical protein